MSGPLQGDRILCIICILLTLSYGIATEILASLRHSVSIHCELHYPADTRTVRVEWKKDRRDICQCVVNLLNWTTCAEDSCTNHTLTWDLPNVSLRISKVSLQDSGTYLCVLTKETPAPYMTLQKTQLYLTVTGPPSSFRWLWMPLLLGTLVSIIVIIFITTTLCFRRCHQENSAPFYSNVMIIFKRKQPPPKAGDHVTPQTHYSTKLDLNTPHKTVHGRALPRNPP
ncbi:uncharacterized protein O3C94_020538 [Discoglossus pictus]